MENKYIKEFNLNQWTQPSPDGYFKEVFQYQILDYSQTPNANFQPEHLHGLEYKSNSLGYRCAEFSGREKILIGGCSFTWGIGLSLENTWANILPKMMGMDYASVAYMGMGIEEIVMNIISYCEKYEDPEYIFCLFPPLHRLFIPNTNMLMSKATLEHFKNSGRMYSLGKININENLQKTAFFKTPIVQEELISWEIAYYFNIKQIHILESFCKARGINLKWSIWHFESIEFIDLLQSFNQTKFNNYLKQDDETNLTNSSQFNFKYFIEKDDYSQKEYVLNHANKEHHDSIVAKMPDEFKPRCHHELREKYFSEFFIAKDFANGFGSVHPGAHFQTHVAERFYNDWINSQ
jgi:hypothetical protein